MAGAAPGAGFAAPASFFCKETLTVWPRSFRAKSADARPLFALATVVMDPSAFLVRVTSGTFDPSQPPTPRSRFSDGRFRGRSLPSNFRNNS